MLYYLAIAVLTLNALWLVADLVGFIVLYRNRHHLHLIPDTPTSYRRG